MGKAENSIVPALSRVLPFRYRGGNVLYCTVWATLREATSRVAEQVCVRAGRCKAKYCPVRAMLREAASRVATAMLCEALWSSGTAWLGAVGCRQSTAELSMGEAQ